MHRQISGQWGRAPNLASNLLKVDALFQCITKLLVTVSVRQVKSDFLPISRISTLGNWSPPGFASVCVAEITFFQTEFRGLQKHERERSTWTGEKRAQTSGIWKVRDRRKWQPREGFRGPEGQRKHRLWQRKGETWPSN